MTGVARRRSPAAARVTAEPRFRTKQVELIEEFEAEVLNALAVTGLPGSRLTCEVTEYVLLDTSERTVEGICRLIDRGVEVRSRSTGVSSPGPRRTAPPPRSSAPWRALATELDMRSVAEGIEDESVHDLAVRLGVGHGQGYLYSRPVPAEQFLALLLPATRSSSD